MGAIIITILHSKKVRNLLRCPPRIQSPFWLLSGVTLLYTMLCSCWHLKWEWPRISLVPTHMKEEKYRGVKQLAICHITNYPIGRVLCFTDCNLQTLRKIKMNANNFSSSVNSIPNIQFFCSYLLRTYIRKSAFLWSVRRIYIPEILGLVHLKFFALSSIRELNFNPGGITSITKCSHQSTYWVWHRSMFCRTKHSNRTLWTAEEESKQNTTICQEQEGLCMLIF